MSEMLKHQALHVDHESYLGQDIRSKEHCTIVNSFMIISVMAATFKGADMAATSDRGDIDISSYGRGLASRPNGIIAINSPNLTPPMHLINPTNAAS